MKAATKILTVLGLCFILGWLIFMVSFLVHVGQALVHLESVVQVEPIVIEREVIERDRPIFWSHMPTETFTSTAYTNGFESTGKNPGDEGYGITKSGLPTRPGVCAVDPDVIPLGSVIWVEGYGYCAALDTGSAIRGKKIDVFIPNVEDALTWGVRDVKVVVLN